MEIALLIPQVLMLVCLLPALYYREPLLALTTGAL